MNLSLSLSFTFDHLLDLKYKHLLNSISLMHDRPLGGDCILVCRKWGGVCVCVCVRALPQNVIALCTALEKLHEALGDLLIEGIYLTDLDAQTHAVHGCCVFGCFELGFFWDVSSLFALFHYFDKLFGVV